MRIFCKLCGEIDYVSRGLPLCDECFEELAAEAGYSMSIIGDEDDHVINPALKKIAQLLDKRLEDIMIERLLKL